MEYAFWFGLVLVIALGIWLEWRNHRDRLARALKPVPVEENHTYDETHFDGDDA